MSTLEKATYTAFIPDFVIETDTLTDYPNLQFISLPGHTSGSIGVMYNNNLFSGDLVMNMPFPSLSWFAEDFTIMKESLKKNPTIKYQASLSGTW